MTSKTYTSKVSAANLNRITLVLAIVGVFIAGVLSLSHVLGVVPPCGSANGGCERVATHATSFWFGIPVAYFGLGAYLTLAGLATVRGILGLANARTLTYLGYAVAAIGMVVSFGLTYESKFVIGAWCLWCLGSTATMTLSFVAHAILAQADPVPGPGFPLDAKLFGGLFSAAVVGLAVQGVFLERSGATLTGDKYKTKSYEFYVPKNAHVLGDADAPITIVEFGDLLCPTCKLHFPQVVQMIDQSQGKVKLVFRHFPMYMLHDHEESFHAAVLSEIANEKGLFWNYVSGAYKMEDESVHDMRPLLDLAQSLGFSPERCIARVGDKNDPAFNRVYDDLSAGFDIGVHATPTFVVLAKGTTPVVAGFKNLQPLLQSEPYASMTGSVGKG